jgi:hypothetical protein
LEVPPIGSHSTSRVALALLCCVFLAASGFATYELAQGIPKNSDTVQSFLAAQSMLEGNVLLARWHLFSDNFYFTDILPLAAVEVIFGHRPEALAAFPTVVFVLITAVCLIVSVSSRRPWRDNLAAIATVALLVGLLPPGIFDRPLLVPDAHTASILFSLVALRLLSDMAGARMKSVAVLMFAIVNCAAVASDPFTLFFAFGPAAMLLGWLLLTRPMTVNRVYSLAAVLVASGAGAMMPKLIGWVGGFQTTSSMIFQFVDPEQLASNVVAVVFSFLNQVGANVLGKDILAVGTLTIGTRLVMWILGGVAALKRLANGDSDLFDYMLAAGVAFLLAACIVSRGFQVSIIGVSPYNPTPSFRYLSPVQVFGAVLAARAIPDAIARLPTGRLRALMTGAMVVAASGLLVSHIVTAARSATGPSWVTEYTGALQWLAARHLTCGVGQYWSSSIFTALSGGAVKVRPVAGPPGGQLTPFLVIADEDWYRPGMQPMFAIWGSGVGVDADAVAATYGKPSLIEHVAGFTIAVLPHTATCKEQR